MTIAIKEINKLAVERFNEVAAFEQDNWIEALDDLRFLDGDQWPDSLKKEREDDKRPCLTINRLPSFIDQIVGDLRQNKMSADVIPVDDQGDPGTAEIYEGIIRNIEYTSKAQRVYVEAGESAVQCGYGAFRVLTRYVSDDSFEQEIYLAYIRNPFTVYIDPSAELIDGSDAKWAFVTEEVTRDEFKRRYPDKEVMSFEEAITVGDLYSNWYMEDKVKIADYYWVDDTKTHQLLLLSDGTSVKKSELTKELYIRLKDKLNPPPSMDDVEKLEEEFMAMLDLTVKDEREVTSSQVMYAKISGSEVLEGPDEWAGKYIPVIPVYGKTVIVDGEIRRRGAIRHAKDSQRQYNYWKSASTEFIALQPKAPYIGTAEQFKNHESQWNLANQSNQPFLIYNHKEGVPRPERQPPPMGSSAMFTEAQMAVDDMKATTNIYDASLGARSNETSGKAIRERKMEGDIANFAFSDNLAASVSQAARIMVDLIPSIYDTERVVRILGPDDEQELVQINKEFSEEIEKTDENGEAYTEIETKKYDLTTGRYDVRAKVGPSYTTQRQETREFMIDAMRELPDMMKAGLASEIFTNSDFPGAQEVGEKMKQIYQMMIGGTGPQNPGEQQPQ